MPLLDHFHPPLHPRHHWESFHSNWVTRIADMLNDQWLPPEFIAEEYTHAGARWEIDIAAFEESEQTSGDPASTVATATVPRVWTPPAPAQTLPATFPDEFEVRIFGTVSGMTLVGAIELISPGNKDRPEQRRAFAAKCASYLSRGVSLVIIDIVTNRGGNLQNETMRVMDAEEHSHMPEAGLYAVAYRPVVRGDRAEIDLWTAKCAVGDPLPVMPLRLTGDLFVPVDFEAAYQEARRRRRLA
jgi:hypothetical protein